MAFARHLIALLLLWSAVVGGAHADDEYVKVKVAEPYIELRTGPGRGYPIFYIAERGEHVEVLKQRTDWYKVRTRKGKEGWVSLEQMGMTLVANGDRLAVAHPDFEAFKHRTWEAGVLTGTFSGADVVSAYGGYHLTRNLSAELEASQYFGSFSNGTVYTVNAVHQPFPDWRISPFFTLGVGRILTEPKATLVQTKDRDDELVNVGIGVRYYFARRFIIRAQYKNYVVFTNRDSNDNIDEWKIGLSAFF